MGKKGTNTGKKINDIFNLKMPYIIYDAKILKMKNVVQLVNFFISKFSASS
jgi:hypothetical protein